MLYYGGYRDGDPPLPIPNREVKLANADGTAPPGGRVGSCRSSRTRPEILAGAFRILPPCPCPVLSPCLLFLSALPVLSPCLLFLFALPFLTCPLSRSFPFLPSFLSFFLSLPGWCGLPLFRRITPSFDRWRKVVAFTYPAGPHPCQRGCGRH